MTEHDSRDGRPEEAQREDREDRAMLAALAWLEGEDAAADPTETTEADATLRRLSVETLGLLPWALDPETPAEGARERLLAALDADLDADAAEGTGAAPEGASPDSPDREPAFDVPPARRAWVSALAAVFVAAALGLGALAGWLWLELDEARSTLAVAQGDLSEAEAARGQLAERIESQERELSRRAGMESFLAAASTAGVEVCPLRPVGDPALHPDAFGILYMPPGSGKWYLVASNLRPGDQGTYKVWLDTPDGAVEVGLLDAGDDSTLEFQLPPDIDARHELMLSIFVTLEPEGSSESPTGPMVLFGEEKLQIL